MLEDVKDWKKKLSKDEKQFLTHIFRFFTQGDIDVHSDLAMEYGIRSVPTLVMKDGNIEVKRMIGMKSKQDLTEWING